MVRTIETKGWYRLACYPLNSWAVFKLTDDRTGIEKTIINGKFADVIAEYNRLTG